jgi:hypothetical protein
MLTNVRSGRIRSTDPSERDPGREKSIEADVSGPTSMSERISILGVREAASGLNSKT